MHPSSAKTFTRERKLQPASGRFLSEGLCQAARATGLISAVLLSISLVLFVACSLSSAERAQTGTEYGASTVSEAASAPTPTLALTTTDLPTTTAEAGATITLPAPTAVPPPTAAAPTKAAQVQATTPTIAPPPISAASKASVPQLPLNRRVILGYYVPYDTSSWFSAQAQFRHLDFVAAQWVSVDACGGIGSQDNRTLTAFARSKGIGILPSLLTMDQSLNHRLLTDEQAITRAIAEIVDYVVDEGYVGFDLDLENVPAGDRSAYTAFVARLSAALHQRGKLLVAALPAKARDATTGWAGAYDYVALASHLDYAMLMTYAYTTATSKPGSTAPYNWVEQVIAFATNQMPASKVLLGLAFYGYDWNVTSGARATALRYDQAAAIAGEYGASIGLDSSTRSATFSYTNRGEAMPDLRPQAIDHEIAVRKPAPCTRPLPSPTPAPPRPAPEATPTPAAIQKHVVWLEDAASVAARLNIADAYDVGGVGAWRLGQEDPAVWPVVEQWRKQ